MYKINYILAEFHKNEEKRKWIGRKRYGCVWVCVRVEIEIVIGCCKAFSLFKHFITKLIVALEYFDFVQAFFKIFKIRGSLCV